MLCAEWSDVFQAMVGQSGVWGGGAFREPLTRCGGRGQRVREDSR